MDRLKYHRAYRKKRVEELAGMKDMACKDCGGRFPPICMDFDHRQRELKLRKVSSMTRYSRTMMLAEISKCDLVCANCHRIRTARRIIIAGE